MIGRYRLIVELHAPSVLGHAEPDMRPATVRLEVDLDLAEAGRILAETRSLALDGFDQAVEIAHEAGRAAERTEEPAAA